MGSKRFYTIPFVWSRTVWTITFATFGLWIGLGGRILYEICTAGANAELWTSFIVFNLVMLLTTLFCEGYAPQRLEVGDDSIVVLRRYKSVVIYRDEVVSVEALPKNALRWAVRTGGVGGLFGYFGRYYHRTIGHFSLYATSKENLFLIRKHNGEQIVVSCSEPDKMEQLWVR